MTSKRYLIGVDLGTSATKAALYDTDGTLVAESSVDVPLYYPAPGVVEQENADFYRTAAQTVSACIRESGIDPRQVAGIAFDSQMASVGSIDADYQPAARFDSWLDMRCQPYIEQIDRDHGEAITRLTGCAPTCDHGPKMLWLQHEAPDAYARVAKFVMPVAIVVGQMAGLRADQAFIDHTFIHFSALCDAQRGVWSDDLISRLGVDAARQPRIVAPWEIVGEVTESAARDFGLAAGTPIAAGAGDTAAGALGAGVVRSGMLLDTAGTASVFAGCTDQFVADTHHRALLCMRSVIPGLWNPLAYIAGGGIALRWFRDEFAGVEGVDHDKLYDALMQGAQNVPPGAEGLLFSPHLGGRICPAEPSMRGAWVGFSFGHTRDHFFRAILEGIAYEYRYYLDILREHITDLSLTEARVIGGGARSPVWNQIKADVLNVPYQRLNRSEFATWGCALIAGHAVGIFPDLTTAAMSTTDSLGKALQPDPACAENYEKASRRYIAWQKAFAHTFSQLENEGAS
ncbi:MAG: xylulose kinase [Anaerolineae bacterium]|nr:xylulose kinase [Anaerolineae bacterium]